MFSRERKRAIWIKEQRKTEDILMAIRKKKWFWTSYTMRRTDNSCTKKVTEWQPRNSERSQGRQIIRWRDETVALPGWRTLTSDRERWKGLGKASVMH